MDFYQRYPLRFTKDQVNENISDTLTSFSTSFNNTFICIVLRLGRISNMRTFSGNIKCCHVTKWADFPD